MMSPSNNGIVTISSSHSVDEVCIRLQTLLRERGIHLFAIIDHSGEAQNAGLHMPATKLFLFGNPKAGTPLMLASPSIAIDLPLKILVAEDSEGKVSISYNSSIYLQHRHLLPENLVANIAVVDGLVRNAAQ